jgi:hypothetical protein
MPAKIPIRHYLECGRARLLHLLLTADDTSSGVFVMLAIQIVEHAHVYLDWPASGIIFRYETDVLSFVLKVSRSIC